MNNVIYATKGGLKYLKGYSEKEIDEMADEVKEMDDPLSKKSYRLSEKLYGFKDDMDEVTFHSITEKFDGKAYKLYPIVDGNSVDKYLNKLKLERGK